MSALAFDLSWRAPDAAFTLRCAATLAATGVTAVYGPSGAGKSTLLACLAGLRRGAPGSTVRFGDERWQEGRRFVPAWRRRAAVVFQDARLFPHLTVEGNLAFAERRAAPGGPGRAAVCADLGIGPLLPRDPQTLSAGQRQRVAIARAVLAHPRLLLLDEPLANLDHAARAQCLACLRTLRERLAIPIVHVSHRIDEITDLADDLLLLHDGALLAHGPVLELAGYLGTPLADDPEAAAVIETTVAERDDGYGLMALAVGEHRLWVQATAAQPGSRRRLRVPARDVSVCREAPRATSILNVLPVTLADLRGSGPAHCLLALHIDGTGHRLLARITRKSADALAFARGEALFAQIKSTALTGDAP